MQEEVEQKTIALVINATKLTGRGLKKAIVKLLEHQKNKKNHPNIPQGKQSVKQLSKQGQGMTSIEITDQNIKDFERVARKYGVDFAVMKDKHQVPPKYVVYFKGKDAYAIYQLKDGAELRDYRFEGLDWIASKGLSVERENYNFVYTEPFTKFAAQRDRLEEIWERFNNDHPADFKGHSLSVSDIVAIKQSGVVTYHYCDSFDFVELTKFAERLPDDFLTGEKIETPRGSFSLTTMTKEQMEQAGYGYHHSSDNGAYHIMGNGTRAFAIVNEDNPLRTAELSTEQNYNQIDGILNNQPTVAQLEQDAKSGKPISLIDLLDATRREEKQSVMEQLKTKPPQDSKKEKTAPSKGAEMER